MLKYCGQIYSTHVIFISVVDCRTPPFIHFGTHSWSTTTYQSVAEYKCDDGYKLIGVTKIQCLYNGKWTQSPTCELPPGKLTHFFQEINLRLI